MLKKLTKYDLREKLCEGLRSGRYKQATGGSTHDGERVCFGVAANLILVGEDGYLGSWEPLVLKLGLEHVWVRELVNRSDRAEATFSELADWIESQP